MMESMSSSPPSPVSVTAAVEQAVGIKPHHSEREFNISDGGHEDAARDGNNARGSTRRNKTVSISSTGSEKCMQPLLSVTCAADVLPDMNPALCTSTPTTLGVSRQRKRSNSNNSVTFLESTHAAHPARPDRFTALVLNQNPSADSEFSELTSGADEVFSAEGRLSISSQPSSISSQTAGQNVHAPIVGYEIMEERSRFTVFKIHVSKEDEDWFIFRRYTDFVRLNDKLRDIFPHFRLSLPPKKWFGDNFDRNFLDDRMLGLQAFLNNITSHRDVVSSEPVRDFFCYDDPPGAHDSLEESKALCELLEEKVYSLKRALKEKDAKITLLEEEVALHKAEVENLRKSLRIERALNSRHKRSSPTSSSLMSVSSHRSDSSIVDQTSYTEADQAQLQKNRACVISTETDSDSLLTPSSTCTDLLENLHDLKLYTVAQSTFDTDPNANCEPAKHYTDEPAKHYADVISDVLYKHTDNIMNSYSRQESSTTITDDQHHNLDQCTDLQWEEDDISSTSLGGVTDNNRLLNNGLLLPAS